MEFGGPEIGLKAPKGNVTVRMNAEIARVGRQARIAVADGVHLVGDYAQRRTGFPPGGKRARCEYGDTARFEKECPVSGKNKGILSGPPKKVRRWKRETHKEEAARKERKVKEKVENRGQMFDLLKLKTGPSKCGAFYVSYGNDFWGK